MWCHFRPVCVNRISMIFTNDADLAGSLYDRALAALETKG